MLCITKCLIFSFLNHKFNLVLLRHLAGQTFTLKSTSLVAWTHNILSPLWRFWMFLIVSAFFLYYFDIFSSFEISSEFISCFIGGWYCWISLNKFVVVVYNYVRMHDSLSKKYLWGFFPNFFLTQRSVGDKQKFILLDPNYKSNKMSDPSEFICPFINSQRKTSPQNIQIQTFNVKSNRVNLEETILNFHHRLNEWSSYMSCRCSYT